MESLDAYQLDFAGLVDDLYADGEPEYVLDFAKYGFVYDDDFKSKFYLGEHLNAAGYIFTAQLITSYIDYIIRHNFEDFSQVGFIGTPYKNTKSE